jgi:hypothetical protein
MMAQSGQTSKPDAYAFISRIMLENEKSSITGSYDIGVPAWVRTAAYFLRMILVLRNILFKCHKHLSLRDPPLLLATFHSQKLQQPVKKISMRLVTNYPPASL